KGRLAAEDGREVLADPLGDRGHLEVAARDVADHLLGAQALALRPELAEMAARLALREPVVAVALAQMIAQLRLEGPRAQVGRDVETGVDVAEVVRVARRHLERSGEELDVPRSQLRRVARGVELELVEELRRIPARDPEHRGRTLGGEVCRPREVE